MGPRQAFVRPHRRGRRGLEEDARLPSPASMLEAGPSLAAMRARDLSVDAPPLPVRPTDLLGLQRTVGNRATGQHLQRMADHRSASAGTAWAAAGAGGPLRRRELSDADKRRIATSRLAADPVAHIAAYYPDHAVTPAFGKFQGLRTSRDTNRTAFQTALTAAGGVGAMALSAQDQANLKQAAKKTEVREAKNTVAKSKTSLQSELRGLKDTQIHVKLMGAKKNSIKLQLESAKSQAKANDSQTELAEVNEHIESLKHKVEGLADIGEKAIGGLAHLPEGVGEVIVKETIAYTLGELGPLGGALQKQAAELKNLVWGNRKVADRYLNDALKRELAAYSEAMQQFGESLVERKKRVEERQQQYVEDLRLLNEELKKQPGLKGLKFFDQAGKDAELIDAFFAMARKYEDVIESSDLALKEVIQHLEDAKRQFVDPNFGAALNDHRAIQGQLQPDRDGLAAGKKQGEALKAKLEQATSAGMGALQ